MGLSWDRIVLLFQMHHFFDHSYFINRGKSCLISQEIPGSVICNMKAYSYVLKGQNITNNHPRHAKPLTHSHKYTIVIQCTTSENPKLMEMGNFLVILFCTLIVWSPICTLLITILLQCQKASLLSCYSCDSLGIQINGKEWRIHCLHAGRKEATF